MTPKRVSIYIQISRVESKERYWTWELAKHENINVARDKQVSNINKACQNQLSKRYQQNMPKSAEPKVSTKHVKVNQRADNFKSLRLLHKISKLHRLEPNTLNTYPDVNLGTMYILQHEIKTKGLFCFTT